MTRKARFLDRWLIALTIASLLICWLFGSYAVRPERIAAGIMASNEQRITLTSSDGVRIAGSYLPAKRSNAPGVLLLHGVRSSRNQFASQARWLNSQGFAVVAIDFRGHGESQQVAKSFGVFESRDARAAFDWLKRKQSDAPVAIIGTSLGGAAALIGEDGPLPADALVLVAVYPTIRDAIRNRITAYTASWIGRLSEPLLSFQSYFRMGRWPDEISPLHAIASYRGPTLVIGGGNDEYTPPSETRALFDAATGRKILWIIRGKGHSVVARDSSEYRRRVAAFLQESFAIPTHQADR